MQFVKYIGKAHRRGITAAEWRGVGINGQTVFWGPENGFSVPLDAFTEEQLRKAIDPDRFFVVVGLESAPDPLPMDMTPEQAEQGPVDLGQLFDDHKANEA